MKKITFITCNKYKAESMKNILNTIGITVAIEDLSTPEIQADTSAEVASYSAKWAAEKLKRPVIKADSGLYIEALASLPGVYTSDCQKKLGPEKVLRLLEKEKNRNAYIRYALAYCEPGGDPVVFESGCEGKIVDKIRGSEGMLIDYIFSPDGTDKTMGELKEIDNAKRELAWGDAELQFGRWYLSFK